ncbi:MAG: altronate dehydratase [Clostridia bacterium]|nr:altronate dehydratase [Clostridia bacterium]
METIKIHNDDNVAVLLKAQNDVPAGHKIALCDIPAGEKIIKYGMPIGAAKTDITKGEHVHTHNTCSILQKSGEYEYAPDFKDLPPRTPKTFMGFKRKDGRVGIRNEVWIITTVGCVNNIAKEIAKNVDTSAYENVDGVYAFTHPYGCSQLGDDQLHTQRLLCGLINHPNAAAVLVLGLGCENNNIPELKKVLGEYDESRVHFLNCQDVSDEIEEGTRIIKELCEKANAFTRTECDFSDLVIGLKCGGSDGFSGITANPLVGRVSDAVISMGGSAILTEVPEMFGAETTLMARARDRKVFDDTVKLINNFKAYFSSYGEPVDENPSPGNKAGGITTLADKSLGCTQKGGSAPVEDVIEYGGQTRKKGLSLLQGPGNDLVAACALAAAGAHIVLFTTGRGTPFGCPVPTVKISTNTTLFEKKRGWIDFNAGVLLEGVGFEKLTEDFLEYLVKVSEGEKTRSEYLDKSDVAIFKDGVTL